MGVKYKQVFNPLSGNFDLVTEWADQEINFSIANDVTIPTDITDFNFDFNVQCSFFVDYYLRRSTSNTSLAHSGRLTGTYNLVDNTWGIANEFYGDDCGVEFSILNSGQIQYTSSNLSGSSYLGEIKIYITKVPAVIGTAEVTTASNLGTGEIVFKQKVGSDFEFKTLKAGSNVSLSSTGDEITIDASATGEITTASNLGFGANIYEQKVASDLQFKTLIAGNNVYFDVTPTEIYINSEASGGGTGLVEIFNATVSVNAAIGPQNGLLHFKAPTNLTVTYSTLQIFEKNGVTSGVMQIDVKKNTTPSSVGMTSIYTTQPEISFLTASDYAEDNGVIGTSSVSAGEYLRLDITSIPAGFIGTIQVLMYAL